MAILTVGIDLAKNVFAVRGVDEAGSDASTTMTYMHAFSGGVIASPLDDLGAVSRMAR